jgi:hypothetical protein
MNLNGKDNSIESTGDIRLWTKIQDRSDQENLALLRELIASKGVEWVIRKINLQTKTFLTVDDQNVWRQYLVNGKLLKRYGKFFENEIIIRQELHPDNTRLFLLTKFRTPLNLKTHIKTGVKLREINLNTFNTDIEWDKVLQKDIMTFTLCPLGQYIYTAHRSGYLGRRSLSNPSLTNGKILEFQIVQEGSDMPITKDGKIMIFQGTQHLHKLNTKTFDFLQNVFMDDESEFLSSLEKVILNNGKYFIFWENAKDDGYIYQWPIAHDDGLEKMMACLTKQKIVKIC